MAQKTKANSSKPARVSPHWRDILTLLPAYDPFRDAAGYRFDEGLAQEKVEFFAQCLCHTKAVKGRPPFLLEPWQQAVVGNLFGWVGVEDGLRRYRECLMLVGRKNGKTPLAAGIILCMLATDNEPGAEIYSAGGDTEQAALVFAYARGMVLAEPALHKRFKIYETSQSIVYEEAGSVYRVVSSEANTKHGFNAHCIVLDELHVQPDRKLLDVLITSMSARKQPLILHLTTSDFDRPSVCNEKHDYASKVRDGLIHDPAFLPVIYEISPEDLKLDPECWKDEPSWYKANPNLGVSKSLAYMRRECTRAQYEPSYLNTFLRLELNIKTEQDQRWLDPTLWAGCQGEVDPAALKGCPCWAGLDLASTADLCGFVLYFPEQGHQVLPFAWVPEEQVKRRAEKGQQDYAVWVRQGMLRTTEGNVADYAFIYRDIVALSEKYDIRMLAYDPWNSQNLANQFSGNGIPVMAHRQGFASMTAPSKELERLVMSGQLQHGNHAVLTWCANNVQIQMDPAGNLKPSKSKSAEKIDLVVALVMSIGAYLLREEQGESVYEQRGLMTI